MIKKLTLLLLVTATLLACTTGYSDENEEKDSLRDSLARDIQQWYAHKKFNGFAVAIVDENGILFQKGFGFANMATKKAYTEKTIQPIASISKTLVGIALLKAQEMKLLKMDDPIEEYLPFRVVNPNFPTDKITIRQLATHTSSIADNEYYLSNNYILKPHQDLNGVKLHFGDKQKFNFHKGAMSMHLFLENLLTEQGKWFNKHSFSTYKPGAVYEYSNVGTALAAFIIERATGQSFDRFTKTYILGPLKMKASGWKFKDVNMADFSRQYENPNTLLPYYELITYPDGGFITSVHDLSKFLCELIKGYQGKGTLLSKQSYAEYFRPQLQASQFIGRNENNPYNESYHVGIFIGYGFTGYIGHTGGDPGVLSMMFFDPKTNLGRIMILNTNFSDKAGNDVFYGIWNVLEKYEKGLKN